MGDDLLYLQSKEILFPVLRHMDSVLEMTGPIHDSAILFFYVGKRQI